MLHIYDTKIKYIENSINNDDHKILLYIYGGGEEMKCNEIIEIKLKKSDFDYPISIDLVKKAIESI